MTFNDSQINVFVTKVLHLGQGKRKEYLKQVDNLIENLDRKIKEDASSWMIVVRALAPHRLS